LALPRGTTKSRVREKAEEPWQEEEESYSKRKQLNELDAERDRATAVTGRVGAQLGRRDCPHTLVAQPPTGALSDGWLMFWLTKTETTMNTVLAIVLSLLGFPCSSLPSSDFFLFYSVHFLGNTNKKTKESDNKIWDASKGMLPQCGVN